MLRRVLEISKHKELSNHILYDDILRKNGLDGITKQRKSRITEKILLMLDFWKEQGILKGYDILSKGRLTTGFAIHR